MTVAEAYPLHWPDGWPRTDPRDHVDARHRWGRGEGRKRRPWKFSEARDELLLELERFGADHITVSTNFRLTQHGLPSRNFGVPFDQGVAIYFALAGKPMVMAQDHYVRAEENLRALALVLKYLRGVEELGGGVMMEKAFAGFEALPPPVEPETGRPWRHVFDWDGPAPRFRQEIELRYRELSKQRHPDRPTGSDQAMAELNKARAEAVAELENRQ